MPSIRQYDVSVDVDVDVEVVDFVDSCSKREIKELIKTLEEDGHLPRKGETVGGDNLLDIEYKNALDKLYTRRIYLTLEEEEFIKQLANRF